MKKLKLIMILFGLLMITMSCSSQDPFDDDLSIYGNLRYDWLSMTFTQNNSFDILYQAGNPFDDFVILHQEVTQKTLLLSDMNSMRDLFDVLTELSNKSDEDIGIILLYTSSVLKQAMDSHMIVLTIDHIVVFNQLKVMIDEIKDESDDSNFYISKMKYIEKRRMISLSFDEIEALDLLQENYASLLDIDSSIRIYEQSFDQLMLIFEENLYVIDEETKLILENAYQIIMSLHQ